MLGKIFKWLYLLLSGLSFIILLFLIGTIFYFYIADDKFKLLVNDFADYQESKKQEPIYNDEIISYQQISSQSETDNSNSIFVQEYDTLDKNKKELETKNGIAYLRLSQIMYVKTNPEKDANSIVLTNSNPIDLNNRRMPLIKIDSIINDENNFYKTKSYLINCKYIKQIYRSENNSFTYVMMENMDVIKWPENHIKPLKEKLNQLYN